jgi:transposase InsO family protein
MRFAFIQARKAFYPVSVLCRVLHVTRPGFYAWLKRPESNRSKADRRLAVLARAAHEESRRSYGSPRLVRELRVVHGEHVGKKRMRRLMVQEGLKARVRRRYKCTTNSDHDQPVAPNLLDRQFKADGPNQRWVGDTTELLIGDGGAKFFLAAILDLYSRFVVGWAVSAVNDRHLCLKALDMALRRRCPGAGLLHHSDQGSTYASEDYQKLLKVHGITCSMSRRGNCIDNAAMESWFSTLKAELGERFDSYGRAKEELFDYIEAFYNRRRRHSSLDYLSPVDFEQLGRETPVLKAAA